MQCITKERTYYYNTLYSSRLVREDKEGNQTPIFGADGNAVIVLNRDCYSIETIDGEVLFYSNGDYNEALERTLSADSAAKISILSEGHTYTREEYEQEQAEQEQDGNI